MDVARSAPQGEGVVFAAPARSGFHGHAFNAVLSSSVRNPTSPTCLQRSIIAVLYKLSKEIVNASSVDILKVRLGVRWRSQLIPN